MLPANPNSQSRVLTIKTKLNKRIYIYVSRNFGEMKMYMLHLYVYD